MLVRIRFPEFVGTTPPRPLECPRCGGPRLYRHKRYRQKPLDPTVRALEVWQYRCPECRHVFTHRPPGLDKAARQTQRLKLASVLLYVLGLSYRNVSEFLRFLGCPLDRMAVWRNVQEAGERVLSALRRCRPARQPIPVAGADETVFKVRGEDLTVGFLVDPHQKHIWGIDILVGRGGETLTRWLQKYAQRLGVEVLVSDDLDAYTEAASQLGLEHQLCLAHVRKAVALRLKKIESYPEEKNQVLDILRSLTPEAQKELKRLHRRFSSAPQPLKGEKASSEYRLRMLTLDLWKSWDKLVLYRKKTKPHKGIQRDPPRGYTIPHTNNDTERAIGLGGKIRYRTLRGYQRKDSLLKTTALIACLAGLLPFFFHQIPG